MQNKEERCVIKSLRIAREETYIYFHWSICKRDWWIDCTHDELNAKGGDGVTVVNFLNDFITKCISLFCIIVAKEKVDSFTERPDKNSLRKFDCYFLEEEE